MDGTTWRRAGLGRVACCVMSCFVRSLWLTWIDLVILSDSAVASTPPRRLPQAGSRPNVEA